MNRHYHRYPGTSRITKILPEAAGGNSREVGAHDDLGGQPEQAVGEYDVLVPPHVAGEDGQQVVAQAHRQEGRDGEQQLTADVGVDGGEEVAEVT